MAGNRYVPTIFTALDENGAPLPGAKLYFYENNSTTPKDTWSDVDLVNANDWPVEADGAGRFTNDIFLDTDTYRIKLTDSNDVQIWSKDDCNTFNGPSSASSFPFPGAVVDFYGTQNQLNVALANFWYVFDGNNGLPNLDGLFVQGCIDVGSIGGTGGSTLPTGTVEEHILTLAETPTHDHYNGVGMITNANNPYIYDTTVTDTPGNATRVMSNAAGTVAQQGTTSEVGSGTGHDHVLTMDVFSPPFYTLIKLVYLGF